MPNVFSMKPEPNILVHFCILLLYCTKLTEILVLYLVNVWNFVAEQFGLLTVKIMQKEIKVVFFLTSVLFNLWAASLTIKINGALIPSSS